MPSAAYDVAGLLALDFLLSPEPVEELEPLSPLDLPESALDDVEVVAEEDDESVDEDEAAPAESLDLLPPLEP
jgi:hypothetical protein